MAAKFSTMPDTRAYEDFDPAYEWAREEEAFTTLLIHLPGFRKDQLKLQVDAKLGTLRVTGERPLDSRRWHRFIKQFPIPENCTTAGVRAKFENETLNVRFPMVVVPPPPAAPQQPPSQKSTIPTTAPAAPPQTAAETTAASERDMTTTTQKANGKSAAATGDRALTEEKSRANGRSTVARDDSEKKKEEITKLTQHKEEVAGKEKIDQEGISKKPEQQMISKNKTGNGKSAAETGGRALTEEKSRANGRSTVARDDSEKKKEEVTKLTPHKEEVAGKEKIDQEGISKKPEQQMISKNKTGDDKSIGEQKTVQPSSPSPDDGHIDRVREEMAKYGVGGILTAGLNITPRKILLVNVAMASLVLLGLGLYYKYK